MRIMTFIAVVLAVAITTGCGQPVRGPLNFPVAKRLIYPLILVNAEPGDRPIWDWPMHGYGRTYVDTLDVTALGTAAWYQTWAPGCADDRQIPMVWRDEVDMVWPCNDYRPLLVANEPERVEEANMPPEAVADVVHALVWGGWRGEILCCGTWVSSIDYLDAVIASYESRYGDWDRAVTGLHAHAYSGDAWAADINSVSRVRAAVRATQQFVAHYRAAGHLGRGVVISEYGVLSSRVWHQPAELMPAFLVYEAGFRSTPGVVSWAWFSSRSKFSSSDLLEADGRLTPLGVAWRAVAIR